MTIHLADGSVTLHHGDCRDVLAGLEDESISSIVTDPPYELGFMGKAWDASGIAYDVEMWRECLRVLKPGGHLLAFGGTRTYHRMAVAIEDAGFEIRDSLHWIYGSGFPKSLDVSKAIDKRGGVPHLAAHIGFAIKQARENRGWSVAKADKHFCGGTTNWSWYEGRPAGQRPPTIADFAIIASEWPELAPLAALVAEAEREVVGKSQWSNSASHFVPGEDHTQRVQLDITTPATDAAKQWDGWGTGLKPAHEPIVLARKPLIGTVAANVLEHGTGALNIDGARVPSDDGFEKTWDRPVSTNIGAGGQGNYISDGSQHTIDISANKPTGGRWPANVIVDDTITDDWARYFYCAKPNGTERNAGLDGLPVRHKSQLGHDYEFRDGLDPVSDRFVSPAPVANVHPTVKPVELMRWLVRLVTPPDGIVLDPFTGSGTTLVAAVHEGFDAVGIEMTDEYLPIICGRVTEADITPKQLDIFGGVA